MPFLVVVYVRGRSFNSGTNAPPYHMAVRNSWKLRSFQEGVVSKYGTKFV